MNAETVMLAGHESVVLGALMNGSADLEVTEHDFSSPPNRLIFAAIQRLGEHRGWLAVRDELKRQRVLKQVGGQARLIEISNFPHDADNVAYALDEIREASRQRCGVEIARQLLRGEITVDEAREQFESLKSLKSSREGDDFPEPLSETAFHGLAGDVVRRIEPHTEADSAALLIHVLTIFGNASGRAPHAIADGSRHGTNLFCVCTGESSKSRKGTALSHSKRVFKRADETWAKECITSGLNSGEGLIYSVRDAVTKRVKQKGGSYSAETVDDGVTDKRRMFVESELSSTLRVMSREGNTLSAVIRAAWDDGDLRTAVKNSPNAATGAHISIIGHVTRDEVRRELNATDQANGFANRFLWLAVRRSKCLPEGGHLDDENLNDLVIRLHESIEFAHNAGEITRDERARELWRIVYPQLSEGKPGLLGAITARAEAQVLRLSVIYALLDCSTKIKPDHHRAALAVWNYCKCSARWIFGSHTGDPVADRILSAIRAAGRDGLTRTDISHGIFQRNIQPAALDSALRSLVTTGKAKSTMAATGKRRAERWIAL